MKMIRSIILFILLSLSLVSDAQLQSRLIGRFDSIRINFTLFDSLYYRYSNGRGSGKMVDFFDTSFCYDHAGNWSGADTTLSSYVKIFDNDNKLHETRSYRNTGLGWLWHDHQAYRYDSNGFLVAGYSLSIPNADTLGAYYYSNNNLGLPTIINYIYHFGDRFRDEYLYDKDGNRIRDREYYYDQTTKTYYFVRQVDRVYSNGLLIEEKNSDAGGILWSNIRTKKYTYNAKKQLKSTTVIDWDNQTNTTAVIGIDTNIYDINDDLICFSLKQWDKQTGKMTHHEIDSNFYDLNHNCITTMHIMYHAYNSTYTYRTKELKTFNNYHQPLTIRRFDWNTDSLKWKEAGETWSPYVTFLYYEEFIPPLGISNDKGGVKSPSIQLYPNPAQQYMRLHAEQLKTGEYTVRITDLRGSLINVMSLQIKVGSDSIIPLTSIPPGNYVFSILTKEGKFNQQFTVVK